MVHAVVVLKRLFREVKSKHSLLLLFIPADGITCHRRAIRDQIG
jgi:hypothetical protein